MFGLATIPQAAWCGAASPMKSGTTSDADPTASPMTKRMAISTPRLGESAAARRPGYGPGVRDAVLGPQRSGWCAMCQLAVLRREALGWLPRARSGATGPVVEGIGVEDSGVPHGVAFGGGEAGAFGCV